MATTHKSSEMIARCLMKTQKDKNGSGCKKHVFMGIKASTCALVYNFFLISREIFNRSLMKLLNLRGGTSKFHGSYPKLKLFVIGKMLSPQVCHDGICEYD